MRVLTGLISCIAAMSASVSFAQGVLGLERFDAHKVVRVELPDRASYERMREISDDMWSHRGGPGAKEFRVSPAQLETLRASGIEFEILVDNVQALIDAERASLLAPRGVGADFFADYRRYDEISDFVDGLVLANPALCSRESVGFSLENREIFALRIAGPNGPAQRPAIVLNSLQHAREWVSGSTSLYIANELVEGYGVDARITEALDSVAVYIIPVVNPDGYVHTWDVNRLWRKNRRNNGGGTFGVDLNRNWSVGWGLNSGSSASGSNDTYRGPSPFSEPESQALSSYIASIPNARAHVDLHSYSELILSPWSYTVDASPDAASFDNLNAALRDAIAGVHGRFYLAGPGGSTLYLASGTAPDWTYGEHGIFSWTIELRPATAQQGGFILPPDQIVPTGEETLSAALVLAEFAARDVTFYDEVAPDALDAAGGSAVAVRAYASPGVTIDQNASSLRWRSGSAGPFQSLALEFGTANLLRAVLPAASCTQPIEFYYEVALDTGSGVVIATYPALGADEPLSRGVFEIGYSFDDTFASDLGWTVGAPGDTATTGLWVRGVPNPTNYQPGSGNPDGSGAECFYTGFSAPGAGDGVADIDGGTTTLTSPVIDALAAGDDPYLVYARWFGTTGAPNDYLRVFLSNDAGATWTLVENVNFDARRWERREVRVADLLAPTSQMRVRLVAADGGSASLAEAAVDDVQFLARSCDSIPGDLNGDGVVNFADLNTVLSNFGASGAPGSTPGDATGDGTVNFSDLNVVLSNFGSTR